MVTKILRNKNIMKTDIQQLIPEASRDLVEAVPKGTPRSAALGGILLGGLLGALACMLVQGWLIPVVFLALLVVQRIWVWRSDKEFDRCLADLGRRGLAWQGDYEQASHPPRESSTKS